MVTDMLVRSRKHWRLQPWIAGTEAGNDGKRKDRDGKPVYSERKMHL